MSINAIIINKIFEISCIYIVILVNRGYKDIKIENLEKNLIFI